MARSISDRHRGQERRPEPDGEPDIVAARLALSGGLGAPGAWVPSRSDSRGVPADTAGSGPAGAGAAGSGAAGPGAAGERAAGSGAAGPGSASAASGDHVVVQQALTIGHGARPDHEQP